MNVQHSLEPKPITVVGIVASAGGLEAITQFLQFLPEETGASYVIAQHMSPTHKSLMATLVARETKLEVVELNEEQIPRSNVIYVTPPNMDVILKDGKLTLLPPSGQVGEPKPSGDRLFKSLAEELGEQCMGIVLSGTGSDGSYGVQAIREAGGITIAQDIGTAKFDGMPASAVETGCIDLCLKSTQIGQHLAKILALPRDFSALSRINESPNKLSDLLQILLARTRVDFRDYKENTIYRRIQRRMIALEIPVYEDYVAHCRTSAAEVDALFKDLLISVTRFFRDAEMFADLHAQISAMVEKRDPVAFDPIRVWVAGCATGEEAYSIAISLAEALGGPEFLTKDRVQIFATDIDANALKVARQGRYTQSALSDVPEPYRKRYFTARDGRIDVRPELKSVILFSDHNVFHDPPFINVDLVTLRNLLIYFNPTLQERVLNRVYYALNPEGLLFLGSSESIGSMQRDFESVTSNNKIFRKRRVTSQGRDMRLHLARSDMASKVGLVPRPSVQEKAHDLYKDMFDGLARSLAPNSMLVTQDHDIIRVFGEVSEFIQLSEDTKLNLKLSLLKSPFREEAPGLTSIALRRRVRRSGLRFSWPGPDRTHVRQEVVPINLPDSSESYVLLAFIEENVPAVQPSPDDVVDKATSDHVRHLEAEVQTAREALQQTIEELQTSNEEMQSVNEELQSTNEELQATNEELETSNEELQSTNEELITVNEEIQVNATELTRVTTDLESILRSVPSAILVVDNALQITRASEAARDMFNLPGILERFHLSQCDVPIGFPSLTQIANDNFRHGQMQEHLVDWKDTLLYLKSAPYTDQTNVLRGVVLMVSAINARDLPMRDEARKQVELVNKIDGIGQWKIDFATQELEWNPKVFEIFGMPPDSPSPSVTEVEALYHPDDRNRIRRLVIAAVEKRQSFDFTARILRKNAQIGTVECYGSPVLDDDGNVLSLVGVFIDVSERIHRAQTIESLEVMQDPGLGFFSFDVKTAMPYWSRNLFDILEIDPQTERPSLEMAIGLFEPEDGKFLMKMREKSIREGENYQFDARIPRKDGRIDICRVISNSRHNAAGKVSHVFGTFEILNGKQDQLESQKEIKVFNAP